MLPASENADRVGTNAHAATIQNMGVKMAKPRKSLQALRLSGTLGKNPGRYAARHEPIDDRDIGEPYEWLSLSAQDAWRELVPTLPWLRYSHRGIVGITAMLIAKMRGGELGIAGMNLHRLCLGKLGATPVDFGKVNWSPPSDDEDDPAAAFFR